MERGDGPGRAYGGHAGQPFSAGIPWERHWSFARLELGLSDAEFWGLTLHEVDVLAVRWQQQQRRQAMPQAMLLQAFLNVHRDPQQSTTPLDVDEVLRWFGYGAPPAPSPVASPATVEAQIEVLHSFYSQVANGQTG